MFASIIRNTESEGHLVFSSVNDPLFYDFLERWQFFQDGSVMICDPDLIIRPFIRYRCRWDRNNFKDLYILVGMKADERENLYGPLSKSIYPLC